MVTAPTSTLDLKISGSIAYDVPLSFHTTFKVGGPADIFITPASWGDVIQVKQFAEHRQIPLFILGGGSNILVSDRGIRGIVLDTGPLNRCEFSGTSVIAEAGCLVSEAGELAYQNNLSGLEFIYGMPGTIGGAVWMNARCYGASIADILDWVDYVNPQFEMKRYLARAGDFDYKRSPFQNGTSVICRASFHLKPGEPEAIRSGMDERKRDREAKGHYLYPCAGSVFKNNRLFGKPTGRLIDELGLKGFSVGGAKVADYHGNIIINAGNATADDILGVIEFVENKVLQHYGFALQREVLLAGEW